MGDIESMHWLCRWPHFTLYKWKCTFQSFSPIVIAWTYIYLWWCYHNCNFHHSPVTSGLSWFKRSDATVLCTISQALYVSSIASACSFATMPNCPSPLAGACLVTMLVSKLYVFSFFFPLQSKLFPCLHVFGNCGKFCTLGLLGTVDLLTSKF